MPPRFFKKDVKLFDFSFNQNYINKIIIKKKAFRIYCIYFEIRAIKEKWVNIKRSYRNDA